MPAMNIDKQKLIRNSVSVLFVLSILMALFGILSVGALKINRFSDLILSYYPRYPSALNGIKILEKFDFPLKQKDNSINVGLLNIENPSWPVMLDFIQSNIAFRKSGKNKPFVDEENKDMIKVIVSASIINSVMRAGNEPLIPPHRLIVFLPNEKSHFLLNAKHHIVYQFLNFREFKLDVKRMIVGELEFFSWILALIGLALIGCVCYIRRSEIKRVFRSYLSNLNYKQIPEHPEIE